LVFQDVFSDNDVMSTILNMYYELPAIFKETPPMTGRVERDIYGYQAANIQATLQLLRMIIFSMEDGPGIERKCDVASEVLSVFHTIPREYLRAISTPLVFHLGSIGQILASTIDETMTEETYQRVRISLISMADLLDGLEEGLLRAAGASQGLRAQVQKLDERIRRTRLQGRPTHATLPHIGGTTNPVAGGLATGPMSAQLDHLDQASSFQLPPELFGDWSWPHTVEYGNAGGTGTGFYHPGY